MENKMEIKFAVKVPHDGGKDDVLCFISYPRALMPADILGYLHTITNHIGEGMGELFVENQNKFEIDYETDIVENPLIEASFAYNMKRAGILHYLFGKYRHRHSDESINAQSADGGFTKNTAREPIKEKSQKLSGKEEMEIKCTIGGKDAILCFMRYPAALIPADVIQYLYMITEYIYVGIKDGSFPEDQSDFEIDYQIDIMGETYQSYLDESINAEGLGDEFSKKMEREIAKNKLQEFSDKERERSFDKYNKLIPAKEKIEFLIGNPDDEKK